MPYTTEIDHQHKIIKNIYRDIITKDDLAGVWRHLLSLKEFTELKYNLLSDYRNSTFNISNKDGGSMMQFLMSVKHVINGKKEGAILSDPKDTALAMLLQLKTYEEVGYEVKLFSTEKAALNWLSNPPK